MITLTVTSNEQEFIDLVARSDLVEIVQDSVKPLPLTQVRGRAVTAICLVDETKVDCGLGHEQTLVSIPH